MSPAFLLAASIAVRRAPLFAGHALRYSPPQKAAHIFRNDRVVYRLAGRLVDRQALRRVLCFPALVADGQHFQHRRLLAEHGHKIGVSHIQRVKRALAELPAEHPCDGKAIAQRDVLGRGIGVRHGLQPAVRTIFHSLFADGQHAHHLAVHMLGHRFKQVGIVAACQPAVARDHDIAGLFHFALLHERRGKNPCCRTRCL